MFVSQDMLVELGGSYQKVVISISQPIEDDDGFFYSSVTFSSAKQFNARIRGADGINCLESALVYMKGVCSGSDDPRFYLDEDEPYMGI